MANQTNDHHEVDPLLNAAHRFEYWVVLVLVLAVVLITLLAMVRLFFGIYDAVFVTWDPRNYYAVQVLFGMVMTVLIALEFGNSILRHIRDHSSARNHPDWYDGSRQESYDHRLVRGFTFAARGIGGGLGIFGERVLVYAGGLITA